MTGQESHWDIIGPPDPHHLSMISTYTAQRERKKGFHQLGPTDRLSIEAMNITESIINLFNCQGKGPVTTPHSDTSQPVQTQRAESQRESEPHTVQGTMVYENIRHLLMIEITKGQ